MALMTLIAWPLAAQTVNECDDWLVSARNLAEPWAENTRTFANGKTRLAVIDTAEPAAASFHLLVLSPPYGEHMEGRQCRVISYDGGLGFNHIDLEGMQAAYDPATGLIFDITVYIWISDLNIVVRGLYMTLNQATGDISVEIRG